SEVANVPADLRPVGLNALGAGDVLHVRLRVGTEEGAVFRRGGVCPGVVLPRPSDEAGMSSLRVSVTERTGLLPVARLLRLSSVGRAGDVRQEQGRGHRPAAQV